ncbi:MAG: Mov34/MPN/PAD-1 family protein [Anaerolineales bacterium]|nr:Mov34/MPN/PAD-1 family protein [Anaerolineales bacterium]
MEASRISLTPPEVTLPRNGRIPIGRAVRWWSPYEAADHETAVAVFMSPRAFVRVCAHAGSDLDNEVGGWLLGKWRADRLSGEQFIVIENSLPARDTRHGSAHLTFTQNSQVALYNEVQERYPNKDVLGWYHTHPRMGVFLSELDTWLHRNFFPDLYQVALVVEPHSASGGFFVRRPDGWLDARRYYGFFELNNGRKRSVVHWRNMLSESERKDVIGGQLS